MIQEGFSFYKPCKVLQPYVRYYWVFKSNRLLNTLTWPVGCPQIIFHKQTPLYIPELNTAQDKLTISGQVNFPSHLYADGNTEMIVIVFQPHAMSLFLHTPVSLFYNQEVSGYDLGNKGLEELAARISDCADYAVCIACIERWLLAQMQHRADEGISPAQIAYASGYADQSHFIREFKKFSGHTPLSLLKVVNPYSDLFTNPV